jgi:hypothetical protein
MQFHLFNEGVRHGKVKPVNLKNEESREPTHGAPKSPAEKVR